MEGQGDAIHEEDQKELEVTQKAVRQSTSLATSFKHEYTRKRSTLVVGGGKKKKPPAMKNNHGRGYPSPFPPGDLNKESATEFTPPGWKIYEDSVNQRWQSYGRGRTYSRAFWRYGHQDALKQCLQASWQDWCVHTGHDISECPVLGLFPAPPEVAVAPIVKAAKAKAKAKAKM